MPLSAVTTPPRRSFRAAALGFLALVAVVATGCAVPDAQPNAANVHGGSASRPATAASARPATAASSAAKTAPAPAGTAATTTNSGTTTKPGAGARPTGPAPVPTADALAALLLAPADIDRATWDVLNGAASRGGPDQHKLCGDRFPSDSSWRTRADGTVVRHADGLRVEEETDGYAGSAARTAVGDFAAAFAKCHDYVAGSGAGKLVVHIETAPAPAYGVAATAADEVLTSGQATVYAHVVVVAQAHLLVFASVVGDNHDAVVAQEDALVRAAMQKAHVEEG